MRRGSIVCCVLLGRAGVWPRGGDLVRGCFTQRRRIIAHVRAPIHSARGRQRYSGLEASDAGRHLGGDLEQIRADGSAGGGGEAGPGEADAAQGAEQYVGHRGEPQAQLVGVHGPVRRPQQQRPHVRSHHTTVKTRHHAPAFDAGKHERLRYTLCRHRRTPLGRDNSLVSKELSHIHNPDAQSLVRYPGWIPSVANERAGRSFRFG